MNLYSDLKYIGENNLLKVYDTEFEKLINGDDKNV